jgi:hypothetical protein
LRQPLYKQITATIALVSKSNTWRKKMKKTLFMLVILTALVSTAAYAAEKEYKGYISDVLCGSGGKDPAGNDLTINPEKHTLACMQAPQCAASGYGIFIKDKEGKYVFHKFDNKGSDMAKKKIIDSTKKKEGIMVAVKGDLQADGSIKIKSIKMIK